MKGRFKRIYAFPNSFGFVGFFLFLVILLAGGTYQNNLIFMMAFLVLSLGLIAALHTARNIRDIEVVSIYIEPSFAGGPTTTWVTLKNNSNTLKLNIVATLETKKKWAQVHFDTIEPKSTATMSLQVLLPPERGRHQLRRLRIATNYPYALFNTWTFLETNQPFIVYPALLGSSHLPKSENLYGDDYSGHKPYESTDSLKRVDWKIFSRQQTLFVKEFNDGAIKSIVLDWKQAPGTQEEIKLSQLATWAYYAEKNGFEYQLNLPNSISSMAHGQHHYHACLERLAFYK